ncbi:MAG: hypothetical protein K8H74_14610 [Notoacmeibacter sp.]|nr:hypothetical protein [Notoacmeibacter sp.]
MDPANRNAMIAAAAILVGFGLVFYYMPAIMLAVGNYSPILAAAVGAVLVLAFFAVFWLRGRHRRNGKD